MQHANVSGYRTINQPWQAYLELQIELAGHHRPECELIVAELLGHNLEASLLHKVTRGNHKGDARISLCLVKTVPLDSLLCRR